MFFVGRGLDYALSMEAALKLKEVSYVFSEAYAAGELKHGPIALLQEGRLVVATITQPSLLDKTLSNLREVKARGAHVLAICREDLRDKVVGEADELVLVPAADDLLAPLLAVIPLQLFAYCMRSASKPKRMHNADIPTIRPNRLRSSIVPIALDIIRRFASDTFYPENHKKP